MREYRFSLDDLYEGRVSLETAANCAAHLARGGAVGEYYGGQLAVTAEVEAIWEVTYVLALANTEKKHHKQVKPHKYPTGVRELERRAAEAATHAEEFWEQDDAFQETKASGGSWGDL